MTDIETIKTEIYEKLRHLNIRFSRSVHEPLFTCEDAERLRPNIRGGACKNLFARNKKGDIHYLIVAAPDRRIDLRSLRKKLGATALSFASEKRMQDCLRTRPGSVSPLGLIFDTQHKVQLVLDQGLMVHDFLNFHPNDNTETVEIPKTDFLQFLSRLGYQPIICEFPSSADRENSALPENEVPQER